MSDSDRVSSNSEASSSSGASSNKWASSNSWTSPNICSNADATSVAFSAPGAGVAESSSSTGHIGSAVYPQDGEYSPNSVEISAPRSNPVFCELPVESLSYLVELEALCNRPPWTRQMFLEEFGKPNGGIYGARLGGALVGFAVTGWVHDEAFLLKFGVAPEHRGKGLGGALLSWTMGQLWELGIRTVWLEVRKSNAVAQRLYLRHGFAMRGVRANYYSDDGEDALVMSKFFEGRP